MLALLIRVVHSNHIIAPNSISTTVMAWSTSQYQDAMLSGLWLTGSSREYETAAGFAISRPVDPAATGPVATGSATRGIVVAVSTHVAISSRKDHPKQQHAREPGAWHTLNQCDASSTVAQERLCQLQSST